MLIPADFINIPQEEYQPAYKGDPKPNDYYCNSDTTIEIGFLKMPKKSEDLKWCKDFVQMAFLMRATKTCFNDSITVNDVNIYVAEFENTFKGKETYNKMFFLNLENETVFANMNCTLEQKDQWSPVTKQILNSISINE